MEILNLIVTDIDGTLLNTKKQISNNTKNYLIKIQKKGVKVALCSGRIPSELKAFSDELKLNEFGGYIIHTNGSGIINCQTKERINFESLKKDDINNLVNRARKNHLYIIAQNGESYIVECGKWVQFKRKMTQLFWPDWLHFKNPRLAQFKYMSKKFIKVNNVPEKLGDTINKLCFRGKPKNVDDFENYVLSQSNIYNSFRITTGCLEVNRSTVSKGVAVEYLRNALNIPEENVVAFGDSANDHEMLKSVINSVAMKNADAETKQLAKFISDKTNDEDGIIEFIKSKYNIE